MVQKRLPVSGEVIYSTYPEFEVEYANIHEPETLLPGDQLLVIALNKRKIDGVPVTKITGFKGKRMDLIRMEEALAAACHTSGLTRMYDIILERDVRKRAYVYLHNQGFGVQFATS
jgi:translation initiation factor 1 (eIF-1/SUI1)